MYAHSCESYELIFGLYDKSFTSNFASAVLSTTVLLVIRLDDPVIPNTFCELDVVQDGAP